MQFQVAAAEHFPAFLALQSRVYVNNLDPSERANGFVSTEFTAEQLREVTSQQGLFVVEGTEQCLAGFVFGLPWEYCMQRPLFQTALARFPLQFKDHEIHPGNCFQWGPVAVAPEFRGRGVLEFLFQGVKAHFVPRYRFGATFINTENQRSLAAHTRKLGMQIIDEFSFRDTRWCTLGFHVDE